MTQNLKKAAKKATKAHGGKISMVMQQNGSNDVHEMPELTPIDLYNRRVDLALVAKEATKAHGDINIMILQNDSNYDYDVQEIISHWINIGIRWSKNVAPLETVMYEITNEAISPTRLYYRSLANTLTARAREMLPGLDDRMHRDLGVAAMKWVRRHKIRRWFHDIFVLNTTRTALADVPEENVEARIIRYMVAMSMPAGELIVQYRDLVIQAAKLASIGCVNLRFFRYELYEAGEWLIDISDQLKAPIVHRGMPDFGFYYGPQSARVWVTQTPWLTKTPWFYDYGGK